MSHSWACDDAYENLTDLLDAKPNFKYINYSVSKDSPIHDAEDDFQLKNVIKAQIKKTSVVLIIAGAYSTYSKWINIEIFLAQNAFTCSKPTIDIESFDSEKLIQKKHQKQ